MEEKRIILGYPLDLLFDRTCKFSVYEDLIDSYNITPHNGKLEKRRIEFLSKQGDKKIRCNLGGIILPHDESPGTGNIIIRGKPGTAKSTFALQIACSAAQPGNDSASFYITLEESPENVLKKCDQFGWKPFVKVLDQIHMGFDIGEGNDINAANLLTLFSPSDSKINTDKKNISPRVIISTLSPRNIFKRDSDEDLLFHTRYDQLENLLISASLYNENLDNNENRINVDLPKIGMIFIDSLNVFGEKLLSRDQLFRIFDLFKQYGILGIFVVEEDEKSIYAQENTLHSETIEYISDMVVSLTVGEDEGYSFRYFEISKSRYQHQVYGKHPFKIYETEKQSNEARVAVKIYPSLHYLVYGTDIGEPGVSDKREILNKQTKAFCEQNANFYLPKEHKKNSSILIEGPRDTFKTSLARDFLMNGLMEEEATNVLFIRFLDYYSEEEKLKAFRISKDCKERILYEPGNNVEDKQISIYKKFVTNESGIIKPFWDETENEQVFWEGFSFLPLQKTTKRILCTYKCVIEKCNKVFIEKSFTELIYQSGYLLPEEFMQILLEAITGTNGKLNLRIVLDDIGKIGSSYPLLYKSKYAGEIFLTAVFHIIRNYKIKLLITGTTGEYFKSDEVIEKVKTLVDDVLTTKKINVFGDNFVTLQGGTLTSSESQNNEENINENVPGVIIPTGRYGFRVDKDKFTGLVGFDTDKIYRPDITLYFNRENDLHGYYNEELRKMLKYAFAEVVETVNVKKSKNTLLTESSREGTATILDSLGLLEGKPIKNTVIIALDEFFTLKDKSSFARLYRQDDEDIYTKPYYNNVLFLAVNNVYASEINQIKDNLTEMGKKWDSSSWKGIEDIILEAKRLENNNFKLIDFSPEITETQICILLDVISSTYSYEEVDEVLSRLIKLSGDESFKIENEVELLKNLLSIRNILRLSPKTTQWTSISNFDSKDRAILPKLTETDVSTQGRDSTSFRENLSYKGLTHDSLFYICWYSELRFLLDRYPNLAPKIEVYGLPGKGYQGDWTLAILKGSVSENLGRVVLKMLCDEREDFKRFVQGIGLPTSEKIFNNESVFLAWPGFKMQNKLSNIFEIYKTARKRSEITGYLNLRLALSTLFKELIMFENDDDISSGIVKRLPIIINTLLSNEEKDKIGKIK